MLFTVYLVHPKHNTDIISVQTNYLLVIAIALAQLITELELVEIKNTRTRVSEYANSVILKSLPCVS